MSTSIVARKRSLPSIMSPPAAAIVEAVKFKLIRTIKFRESKKRILKIHTHNQIIRDQWEWAEDERLKKLCRLESRRESQKEEEERGNKKKRPEISSISKIPQELGFRFEQFQQGIEPFTQSSIMCRLVAGEDTTVGELDHHQSTVNGTGRMHPQIQAQIARLEARISRVEARMERLESEVNKMKAEDVKHKKRSRPVPFALKMAEVSKLEDVKMK
ncbi:hypothetical protein L1887_20952 [Cichorium endivia]|nr:hypothetical protein L1887_20952 [Cichorium endivia]